MFILPDKPSKRASHLSLDGRPSVAEGWSNVFTVNGTDYLCVVDYYSSYFEVDKLESKTAKEIAKKFRRQFSVHGIPNQLTSVLTRFLQNAVPLS